MKNEYESPEFKYFKVTLEDVLGASVTEPTIPEVFGGDSDGGGSGEGGDPLDGF